MEDFITTHTGVEKLLPNLDFLKAPGPIIVIDKFLEDIDTAVSIILTQLCTGSLS